MNLGERGSGSRRAKSASRPSCFSKFRRGMSPASLTMRPPSGVAVTCCRPMLQKVSCLGHPVAIILSLLAVPSAFTAATWTPSEALCSGTRCAIQVRVAPKLLLDGQHRYFINLDDILAVVLLSSFDFASSQASIADQRPLVASKPVEPYPV